MRHTVVTVVATSMLVVALLLGVPNNAQSQVVVIIGNGSAQPYYPPYSYPNVVYGPGYYSGYPASAYGYYNGYYNTGYYGGGYYGGGYYGGGYYGGGYYGGGYHRPYGYGW